MKILSFIAVLFFSLNAWSGADVGLQGECHDGTAFEFSVEKGSCQSEQGTYYLIERALNFCRQHCSVQSGKCSVNRMNNIRVETCTKVLPQMYRGFDVTCMDGQTYEFNTCSTTDGFDQMAARICAGKKNSETGKEGAVEVELKDRCN